MKKVDYKRKLYQKLSLLMTTQNGTATFNIVWQLSTKLNILLPMWFHNNDLWYMQKWIENACPHKRMDVYSNFIHNCQNLRANKMPLSRWMNKLIVVHPDGGILFNIKKRWATKPWEDMEEISIYIIKWKKLKSIHPISLQLYDIIEKAKL